MFCLYFEWMLLLGNVSLLVYTSGDSWFLKGGVIVFHCNPSDFWIFHRNITYYMYIKTYCMLW